MSTLYEQLNSTNIPITVPIVGAAGTVSGSVTREEATGVYSTLPLSTPKHKLTHGSIETQARLLVLATDTKHADSMKSQLSDQPFLADSIIYDANSQVAITTGYIDFLLTSAQEAYTEKVQIVDVLSDNYVAYFFGAAPPVFNYSGMVYNTQQDDWRSALTILYQTYLRGTKLARNKTVVCLSYDEVLVTGALLNMTQSLAAETQTAAQFSFSMLVKDYKRVSPRKRISPRISFDMGKNLTQALGSVISGIAVKTDPSRATMSTKVGTTSATVTKTDEVDAKNQTVDPKITGDVAKMYPAIVGPTAQAPTPL